jgi:hypothetical protein
MPTKVLLLLYSKGSLKGAGLGGPRATWGRKAVSLEDKPWGRVCRVSLLSTLCPGILHASTSSAHAVKWHHLYTQHFHEDRRNQQAPTGRATGTDQGGCALGSESWHPSGGPLNISVPSQGLPSLLAGCWLPCQDSVTGHHSKPPFSITIVNTGPQSARVVTS